MTRTDAGATEADIAEAFFQREGFVVRRVRGSAAKSPDLEVDGDDHWSMGVYRQAKKAVAQMRERDPEHRGIWILW